MSLFGSRPSFDVEFPKVYREMYEWAYRGIIPKFDDATLLDDVLANMLKAVREKLWPDDAEVG